MSRRRRKRRREHNSDVPVAMTGPFLHERVLEIIKEFPRGKLLDIPCGQGALSSELMTMGFEVYCGDLNPAWFKLKSGHIHVLDLNHPLPYKTTSFDCVTCVEGIEHLENPHLLIREIGRILKPGGSIVITTPNIMNIKSRLYFLLRSYFNNFRYFPQPSDQRGLLDLHVNPIPFGELRYILNRYGFRVETVSCNRYTKKYPWLMPFLIPLIRAMTGRKNREAKFLLKRELLEGDILIVSAIKDSTGPISQ
jgi:SAM-dependent methyltransferase